MIRQMTIATALLGFNDLGRSVTPTFQKQILFTIISTLSKNEQKINFTISVRETSNPTIMRVQGA